MDTYECYKLTDWNWIQTYKNRMGEEAFGEYRDEVYKLLLNMAPDSYFNIEEKVKEENRELFIKIVSSFISEGNGNYGFSDDYKKIRYDGEIKTNKKELDSGGEGDPAGELVQKDSRRDRTNVEPASKLSKSIYTQQQATGK